MSAAKILSKFDVDNFKAELEQIKDKFNNVSVSSFKPHTCVDCGVHVSKFSAKRCRRCNMRRVGRGNKI